MTTTTATCYGADFSYQVQADMILAYVDGDDTITSHEKNAMVDALFDALRDEVDERLPEGAYWQPHTSEVVHHVGVEPPSPEDMTELIRSAWSAVEARYEQIERQVLGTLPATVEDLERELRAIGDPVRRARVAGLLVDAGMRQMAAQVRAEAIYAATRDRSWDEVAALLGTGGAAVHKAVYEYNRRQRS